MTVAPRSSVRIPEFRGEVVRRRVLPGFALTELRHRRPSRNGAHEHGLAYFSLLASGSYLERDARGEIPYRTGAVGFHPARYRHRDEIGLTGARFLCVEIAEEEEDRLFGLKTAAARLEPPASEIARIAAAMNREIRADDPASDIVLEGLALQLVGAFVRAPVERDMPPWLRRVAERLREERSRPLRLRELAAAAGVHPVHLARAFRRHFHHSVGEELRRLRVEAVCEAIARGGATLSAAALDAGFADQSHMSRTFRRLTGMTPDEYRVLHRRGSPEVPFLPPG